MKSSATILDDRETVEFLAEHPELLAIADAVRATQTREGRAGTRRARLLLAAAAVAALATVCAVVLPGVFGGTGTHPGGQPPPDLLDYTVNRASDGTISTVAVTARAATLGGSAHIEVVESHMDGPVPATTGRVVFQEDVPMTDIPSPVAGPPGTVALSEWTGTLSPSDWEGGCQNAPYWFTIKVSPASGTGGEDIQSGSFKCTAAMPDGPTGRR